MLVHGTLPNFSSASPWRFRCSPVSPNYRGRRVIRSATKTMIFDNQCAMAEDPDGEARKIILV
jgi:hypothetical protein